MTQLAVACALLDIPVDPLTLYHSDDPLMLQWLADVADRVSQENRSRAEKAKRGR